MKSINLDDPQSKEYLQKIGRIIVEVNFLEMFVELLIWQLIAAQSKEDGGTEQTIGGRITINLSFMEKADLLRSLAVERKGEELTKELTEKIYKNLHLIAEKRDDIAHSLWYIQYSEDKNPKELITEKINMAKAYKRGKTFDFSKAKNKVTLEEFEVYFKLISDVTAQIINFAVNKL